MADATVRKLTLRYMRPADIPEVTFIDRASFNPPWPARSYQFEVGESRISYMVVLEREEDQPVNGLKRILYSLSGHMDPNEQRKLIVGYGGLWKMADESHISTIASHPDYRGLKYGEIVLVGMMRRAIALEASYIVLEVRVSNAVAQNLYAKYGFETIRTKKHYYHYDKEDAYEMHLQLTPQRLTQFEAQYQALCGRIPFVDHFSHTPHPRIGK